MHDELAIATVNKDIYIPCDRMAKLTFSFTISFVKWFYLFDEKTRPFSRGLRGRKLKLRQKFTCVPMMLDLSGKIFLEHILKDSI
jgi:hypothetical protein